MSGADTILAFRGASYAASLECVPVVCVGCVQVACHFPDLPCLSHLDCSVGDRDTMFVDGQTSNGGRGWRQGYGNPLRRVLQKLPVCLIHRSALRAGIGFQAVPVDSLVDFEPESSRDRGDCACVSDFSSVFICDICG